MTVSVKLGKEICGLKKTIFFVIYNFDGFGRFTDIFGRENWKLGWFYETWHKNKMKPLRRTAAPEDWSGAAAGAEARGPTVVPERFQFFSFRFDEYLPRFLCVPFKMYVNTTEIIKNNKWNPFHKIKNILSHWNPVLVIFWPRIQLKSLNINSNKLYTHINVLISS